MPGLEGCNRVMEDLQQYFPNLTRRDMRAFLYDHQEQPNMLLLWSALFKDEHRFICLLVLFKWRQALEEAGEELDPQWFFEFLSSFFVQRRSNWKNMTPVELF